MSEKPTPEFGEDFWNLVHQRAAMVRSKVHEEIEIAEHAVFSEAEIAPAVGPDGNILPVFTDPFWTEVQMRAERVHELARESLAAAEERLLEGDEALEPVTVPAGRPAVATLRNLGRTFNLQRADVFGLVAALLAVVLLVPQLIAPVYSSAGVEPPRILRFVTIGGDNSSEKQAPKQTSEEGSPQTTQAAGSGSSTGASKPGPASSPSPGASASSGASSSATGEGGVTGGSATGTPGSAQNGASDVAAQPSPSAPASPPPPPPPPPVAPVDVHVIPVGSSMVRVAWTDVSSNETGFQVDLQVPEGSAPSTQQADKDATGLTWINLTPESKVCFRVRSIANTEHSDWAPAVAPGYACATLPAAPVESGPPAGSGAQPEASPSPAQPAG